MKVNNGIRMLSVRERHQGVRCGCTLPPVRRAFAMNNVSKNAPSLSCSMPENHPPSRTSEPCFVLAEDCGSRVSSSSILPAARSYRDRNPGMYPGCPLTTTSRIPTMGEPKGALGCTFTPSNVIFVINNVSKEAPSPNTMPEKAGTSFAGWSFLYRRNVVQHVHMSARLTPAGRYSR